MNFLQELSFLRDVSELDMMFPAEGHQVFDLVFISFRVSSHAPCLDMIYIICRFTANLAKAILRDPEIKVLKVYFSVIFQDRVLIWVQI